jgi:hypothetical protein
MRKWVIALSLALFASATACVLLWSELRAERHQVARLSAELRSASRGAGVSASPAASPTLTPAPATPPSSPESGGVAQAAPAVATRHVPGTQQEWSQYQLRLLRDPKYQEAWRAQRRSNYAPRRENLMRLFGFSPAQADAVIELQLDRELRALEHIPPDGMSEEQQREHRGREEAAEREHQVKLAELLGEHNRQRLQHYMESRASRMQVDQLRTQLPSTDALQDHQIEPLITALHEERARVRRELEELSESLDWRGDGVEAQRRYAERHLELLIANRQALGSSAGAILSRSQLETLDSMLLREIERHRTEQKMARLRATIGQASADGGTH